mgnify:CR=1 FL=1|jgi:hypothetical protein
MKQNRSRQIHADIEPKSWAALVKLTAHWPAAKRTQGYLCGFALQSLANDLREFGSASVVRPLNRGSKHVQVRTFDDNVIDTWDELGQRYGSLNCALRVAIAQLITSIRAANEYDRTGGGSDSIAA